MPQLRIFQAWPAYVVTPSAAFEALGIKPNHYQARVVISATSKAAAARTLSEIFEDHYSARVIEETGGFDVEALQTVGRLSEAGELYVMKDRCDAVAQGVGPGQFVKIGSLTRSADYRVYTYTFVPEEG